MSKKSNESGATEVVTKESMPKTPMYKIYKDNGYEIKVANMDHPSICNRQRIVEIECIKKTNFNEPAFRIRNVYDAELGLFFGVPIGVDKNGNIKWQSFVVGDRRRYDCKRHQDAVEWAVVGRAPWLEGSPYQSGKVYYKMFDRDAEAQEVILKSTLRRKAQDIVDKMISIEDQMDMYRNFGKNPEGFTPTMLHAEVIKISERNPKEFIDMWENQNRGPVTIFKRCESIGLIQFRLDRGGYVFKDLPLGLTEQAAIQYITTNKTTMAQMDMESKQKDTSVKNLKGMSDAERNFFMPDDDSVSEEVMELRMEAKLCGIANFINMSEDELRKAIDASIPK